MDKPDYGATLKVLKEHYNRLCVRAATEILENPDIAEGLLEEILDNFARKFYAVGVVFDQLQCRATRSREAPIAPPTNLRVSTVHCRADILTETINEWLSKHSNVDVLSINFAQLSSGLSCIILHRAK